MIQTLLSVRLKLHMKPNPLQLINFGSHLMNIPQDGLPGVNVPNQIKKISMFDRYKKDSTQLAIASKPVSNLKPKTNSFFDYHVANEQKQTKSRPAWV